MKVSTLASGLGVQAPSSALGAQAAGATSFQARLSPRPGGPSAAGVGPTGAQILQRVSQDMQGLLRLQYQLSRGETSLLSNILKTRQDTAKNSIQNLR